MTFPTTFPFAFPGDANSYSLTGGSDGTLAELTSHCESALSLLIGQYQDSPKLQALICGYADRVQALELGLVGVYERGLSIDRASGDALDLIGRILREARDGRADIPYRRALAVRILVNRSQGRLEDLIAIVRLFEDMDDEPGAVVRIQDVPPPGRHVAPVR